MRKILIVRNDRFGEFLLNIPVFRAVKAAWPSCELSVAVSPGVAELAGAVPLVDRVIGFPDARVTLFDQMRLVALWRRERFDAAVVLNPTALAHHIIFACGIPVRVGYARKHAFCLTRAIEDHKALGLKHEVIHNLELAEALGCSTGDLSLELNIPAAVEDMTDEKFGLAGTHDYIAVHPYTSDAVKQWPLTRFQELIAGLGCRFPRKIVLVGRPESWHQELSVPAGINLVDLRGRTTLLELAAVLKRCQVLVSCDSGPVHLAASVGSRVIALFRNDMPGKNPERWGPWGEGHQVIQASRLENITVDEVIAAVRQMF